jgi:hypothetical protein
MGRRISAKRESNCPRCERRIGVDDLIRGGGGRGWVHAHCADDADADDREYGLGVQDAIRYQETRDLLGEDAAAAEELAYAMRFGDD